MAEQLNGNVVLVTGAGSGIGRAVALLAAREGARVVVSDVAVEGGEETVRIIEDTGGEAVFAQADVSKAVEVEALVSGAVESFGRLDCAVNNAGIEGVLAPTADYPDETWNRVLGVNLAGVFLCMKHEIPRMLETGGGSIVNVASILGLVGFANAPAYTAAKHGTVVLTKVAALEYASPGVRVKNDLPAGTAVHWHGLPIENGTGRGPFKDTALGFFHCHNAYHMETGMARVVSYVG